MRALLRRADDVLRARPWPADTPAPLALLQLAGLLAVFGLIYGAVMGTYSATAPGPVVANWPLQALYSGLKVPLLLLVTFALSLPSFFVVQTLLGLRQDFGESVRALVATQAGMTITLASLAPFTLVWYASVSDYNAAILFNTFAFGFASVSAQLVLRRQYRPLMARRPRHRVLLRVWLVVYAFVGVQMGWVLRPFVGSPVNRTTFFREEAWGNAYLVLLENVGRLLGG